MNVNGTGGGRKASPPHPEGVLANLEKYDMRPMSFAGEKVVVKDDKGGFTGSIMAILVARMREKGIPISRLGDHIGRRVDWVLGLWNNKQKSTSSEELLSALDALGLEVVVRLKTSDGPVKSSRPQSLKAAKLLKQKAAEPAEPKVIVVEVVKPRHDRAGVISDEQRADIDRMLASKL